jgi:lysophospholipase L1-like esterase
MRRIVISLLSALSLLLGVGAAAASTPPLPRSMAAIGDSMTRAADACCWYGDHPANSWSTGGGLFDGVRSHYERLRSLDWAIAGDNYNDAVSGARMSDGPRQAQLTVSQGAEYVTLLLGANDVCTSSPSTMTPTDTFRSQARQTLQTLDAGLPAGAHIFVASIPDIHRLWLLYRDSATARFVWDVADICQSMLAPQRTDAERQAVQQRNIDFNTVLAQECAAVTRCRFDQNAVYSYAFTRDQVSKLDYFHPSLSGQAALASVTWARSWWAG